LSSASLSAHAIKESTPSTLSTLIVSNAVNAVHAVNPVNTIFTRIFEMFSSAGLSSRQGVLHYSPVWSDRENEDCLV
jgi:hypothetical protein